MSSGTQICEIVLPGYTLADRIGSGGYAEVWRAEAPGGIQKAVKLVYGYYDDEFASQELKALERIKGVRHPFLLSLERFEIIDGRLAILTELADMSLDQRVRQCRAEGQSGIPRSELMQYMSDASEALDFISQRHNLLHLDIKPENLLILGDHIKVADFGLVKELASRTQNSLVSGMTPTYASPEMFDDEPSAYSDQYSLAIVYQEMLVGTLPFPGRTAAQLAKQHTQAEPQLMSLPAEDRAVVAKALAKNPTERFPSCRAFVAALQQRADIIPATIPAERPLPVPEIPQRPAPGPDDTKPPSLCTTLRRSPEQTRDPIEAKVTQPVSRGTAAAKAAPAEFETTEPIVCEEIVEVAVPPTNAQLRREQPTLYVATGGIGIQLLCRLRSLTSTGDEADDSDSLIQVIALDTDRDELREACSSRWKSPLSSRDTLHLPLRLPKCYDDSRDFLGWVSRRWLYNIPRSLETRGYRPLGRVALVDHSQPVIELIDEKLQQLATAAARADAGGEAGDQTIKVVILTSTGGGTGAGMAIDVANAAKSIAAARGLAVEVHGTMVCTWMANNNASPLVAANTYSLLTELNHATDFGNAGTSEKSSRIQKFERSEAPFDVVYWVPARTRSNDTQSVDALDAVAKYLALESRPEARAVLRTCRTSQTPREEARGRSLSIRKLGFASLADQERKCLHALAAELVDVVKRHWRSKDTSKDWERLVRKEQQTASVPTLSPPTDNATNAPPAVVPVNDATPLMLRGRFKEYLGLEFTSEVLRQIQGRLESRDDRGRPLIVARDAKLIADTARGVMAALAARGNDDSQNSSRLDNSSELPPLIATASRRVLSHAIEKFDSSQPDRFLPASAIDEAIKAACLAVLEEGLARPDSAVAIEPLIETDTATELVLESATNDLLQCGCDRRTIVFAPQDQTQSAAVEQLRSARPLASIVSAEVPDVCVVSEEAGISPRSLALGLERVFPGIADAARRLVTRIDIEWHSLL